MNVNAQPRVEPGGPALVAGDVKSWAAPGVPSERVLPTPSVWRTMRANMGLMQITVLNVGTFLAIWEIVAQMGVIPEIFFPAVSQILAEYWEMVTDGTIAHHGSYSLINLSIGYTLAAVIGVTMGLALGTFRWLNTLLAPYYWSLNSMPDLAILPLIIMWFGFGMESKIVLIVLAATIKIMINSLAGVGTVDPVMIKMAKTMGATPLQRYRKIVLPYTLPFILTGLKLGLSSALTATVVSEMIGSARGLGYVIIRQTEQFNPAGVFAMLGLLAAVALIMVNAMQWLQYRVTPWHRNVQL
jgi:ABC-type nitrate/sulfonate/bicarbonate transport system permease component